MGEALRMAIGIMGNAATLLLYASPILTFKRIIKKRSTEEFSCIPYTVALLNCLLYTWYGLPIVSVKWENFLLITINGFGIFLESSFIVTYIWFAQAERKKIVSFMAVAVIVIFSTTMLVSMFALHDHHLRKLLVGSVGLAASATMYASPLVVMRRVIHTKSVEFMPFYLSFFSLVNSLLWVIYGVLSHELILAAPNLLGTPLGVLQLAIYCKYRKTKGISKEPNKLDLEKNGLELKPHQPVSNGKE
ncbi:bidirectional sugar transporter SWEET3b-like [Magnolia sinica]|uniref:bidirectional sugar transporter SWEET3b-like n=1 Tax=Magnolia sinica TaxID=86752 RepID=UPI002659E773|nr:bidirectional sugar transporter SWEET3b-like [Magnolia sinica]